MFYLAKAFNQPIGTWNVGLASQFDIHLILSDAAFEPCIKASIARSWAGWLDGWQLEHAEDALSACPSCSLQQGRGRFSSEAAPKAESSEVLRYPAATSGILSVPLSVSTVFAATSVARPLPTLKTLLAYTHRMCRSKSNCFVIRARRRSSRSLGVLPSSLALALPLSSASLSKLVHKHRRLTGTNRSTRNSDCHPWHRPRPATGVSCSCFTSTAVTRAATAWTVLRGALARQAAHTAAPSSEAASAIVFTRAFWGI